MALRIHRAEPYLGRRLALLALPVLLAVGVLLVARLEARPFDEGLVVVVGAGGAGQDPHEVAVVAQVLQQAGHPPVQWSGETTLVCVEHSRGGVGPPWRARFL